MITISQRQYESFAADAAARHVEMVAARLTEGSMQDRDAAARAAVRIGHDLGPDDLEDLLLLARILLGYGIGAADPGGVPWIHEIAAGTAEDRFRRLRECWKIAQTVGTG